MKDLRFEWWFPVLLATVWLAGCPEEECVCPDDDSAVGDDDVADDDSAASDDDAADDDTTGDVDADGDGYTPDQGDCDDGDPDVHPGAEDLCGDNVDSDCDEIADRGCQVFVDEGEFLMGADEDVGAADQRPLHAVWLDAYWIDKYEVTIGEYQQCEMAGVCDLPTSVTSFDRDHYYDDPQYVDFPVVYIQRDDARSYCDWVGGYLPYEAQWEKAARGPDDARLYPWGNWYDCSYGNVNWCIGETERIGSYALNLSPYGAVDMAGNVWEYFEDYYDPNFYENSPYENPTGPETGEFLSYRGGAFTWVGNPTVSIRHPARPLSSTYFNIGFRCAYDQPY